MAQLTLFINTSNNTLVAGRRNTQPVAATSLPMFFGDTLALKIYLLQLPVGYDPTSPVNSPLETVSTAGLQLFLFLDAGTVGGTIYTQEIAFQTDANNEYFFAPLALNTQALSDLLGASTVAQAWLKVGYVQDGQQTTVLSQQVSIGVGIPAQALVVPAGQTPLSAEVANATYFPLQPKAGLAMFLESGDGLAIFAGHVVQDPDGGYRVAFDRVNP